ncbi:MAG: GNAT family N-acetyltransferase [Methanomassiliicoccales archaeon]|nr:GNAT family N-acetyltransferase [Methanomassiliicoccales archaeon]NYT14442.1 GNAT family N-acetyltransferase [Methanomassiliicoccales archaeon]
MKEFEGQKISFRPAEKADVSMLVDMESMSFHEADKFSRRKIGRYIHNPSRSIIVDVIETGSRPVGYSVYLTRSNSRTISLHSVCIIPEMRGKGIIRAYLDKRLTGFRDVYNKIVLRVRTSNTAARDLYRSLEFSVDGVEAGYYPDGEDAIRMTKSL